MSSPEFLVHLHALGESLSPTAKLMDPYKVDTSEGQLSAAWVLNDGVRRRNLVSNSEKFTVATTGIDFLPGLTPAELGAEGLVSYKQFVFARKVGDKVVAFHNIELIEHAKKNGTKVLVLLFEENLSKRSQFALSLRHGARDGQLGTMAQMEAVLMGKDHFNLTSKQLSLLLTNGKGKDPSPNDVEKTYNAAKIYEEFGGLKLRFVGSLDKGCYSNVKHFFSQPAVKQASVDPTRRRELVEMVIAVSNNPKEPRMQDTLKRMMDHGETKSLILQGRYIEAKEILESKYPEEVQKQHWHNDIVKAQEKMPDPTVRRLLKAQWDSDASGNATYKALRDFNMDALELSDHGRVQMLRDLAERFPSDFLLVATEVAQKTTARGNEFIQVVGK